VGTCPPAYPHDEEKHLVSVDSVPERSLAQWSRRKQGVPPFRDHDDRNYSGEHDEQRKGDWIHGAPSDVVA